MRHRSGTTSGLYLRYQQADFDTTGLDDAKGYGVGVTYQYTPAMAFRLAYDALTTATTMLQASTAKTTSFDSYPIQFLVSLATIKETLWVSLFQHRRSIILQERTRYS